MGRNHPNRPTRPKPEPRRRPRTARRDRTADGEGPVRTATVRRCVATGDVLPKSLLVRFVVGPEGLIVPDIAGSLPGRGIWVRADRQCLDRAVEKGLLIRAARRTQPAGPLTVTPDLPDRTARLLHRRCLDLLGQARGAGLVVAGFEKVRSWLDGGRVALLLAAADGAADGRRKLAVLAATQPKPPAVVALFDGADLGGALGRGAIVHAAVAQGGLTDRLAAETARLAGVAGVATQPGNAVPSG